VINERKNKLIQAAKAVHVEPVYGAVETVDIIAAAGETKSPPTFDATAYTGGELIVAAYDLPIVIDLAGLEEGPVINANLDHDRSKRTGQGTETINNGKQLQIKGMLNAATPYRDEVVNSSKDGFKWGISVEALPKRGHVELIKAGTTATANGQTFRGPIYIARKSVLHGLAFKSKGYEADSGSKVTIAASSAHHTKGLEMKFEQWIEAQGFDASTLNDKQIASLKVAYEAEIKAAGAPERLIAEPKFDIDELKAAYAVHEAEIEKAIFAASGKVEASKMAEIKAAAYQGAVSLKSEALQKEWSPLQFQVAAQKLSTTTQIALLQAERPVGPAIHASAKDIGSDVIEASLAQAVGLPEIEDHYKPETLEKAHKQFRGRLGLQQALIMAAGANGMGSMGPGQKIHDGNLREVLRFAFPMVEAAFSTVSLPGIFSNVANKELLIGYMEGDESWREVAQIKSVNDFKQATSYRLLDSMEYEEIGPDGRIKHGTVGEETITRQAKTYAKMLSLTRVDIINDDLGAFDDLRSRLGMGAKQKFNKVFWAKFLDNASFFTSGRGNYISGSTTNLGTDGVGLGLGLKAFRVMESPSADGSKRLGGNPAILLHPPELESAADKLFLGEKLNVGSGPGEENVYRNKYRPVCVPWLSDAAFSGYSLTAWYLLRNPRMFAAMVVSFLFGNQSPTVESAEADFATLGIDFRGYHDFGCDQAEYVAGVKSKGAA